MYILHRGIHTLTLALLYCCITIETFYTQLTLLTCGIVGADEALPRGSIARPRDRGINVSIAFTRHARDCWWVAMVTFSALAAHWPCVSTVTSAEWSPICKGSTTRPGVKGGAGKASVSSTHALLQPMKQITSYDSMTQYLHTLHIRVCMLTWRYCNS